MQPIHEAKKIPTPPTDCPTLPILIRHDTLGIIKSETFTQLVSDPLLKDELKQSSIMRKSLLELAHTGWVPEGREE